jgi:dTDP-glucose 4,6-dehydratase
MKTILLTGGAGFIGSNLLFYLIKKYPNYKIVNVDNLTYASNYDFIKLLEKKENYSFYKGSINNLDLMRSLFKKYSFDSILNLAAESHVDNSINNPLKFAETNVLGTINLLNVSNEFWSNTTFENKIFYHISTDEVYGSLGKTGSFTEKTKYNPRSPYSASKASSDHFVMAYFSTYKLPAIISNCSNNFGINQHDEKLIPTVVKNIISKNKIPVYGDGTNVRDWLFVEDHIKAIDLILHNGRIGNTYNIGGGNEISNLQLIKNIIQILTEDKQLDNKDFEEYFKFVNDRMGHDFRYSVDYSKIKNDLGWNPASNFLDSLRLTVNWYKNKYE